MITRPRLWLIISSLTMLVSVVVIFSIGPLWGIDFTGGSLLEIRGPGLEASAVRSALAEALGQSVTVQSTEAGTLLIRTVPLDPAQHDTVSAALLQIDPATEELRFESIGPTIGAELRRKAWWAVAGSLVAMIVYLAYTFRATAGMIKPWHYGVASAVALLHDLLVVTAIFIVLGRFRGVPIDSLFVTAMLALLGYSVNDTIVIFTRFKAEWSANKREELVATMDRAVRGTLMRSLNTALTTLVILVALLLFGGSTIYWFVVALTLGTIVGAYSSIFVSPPFLHALVTWKR